MRTLLLLPLAAALSVPIRAQLVVPLLRANPAPFNRPHHQAPLLIVPFGPGPAMPPSDTDTADHPPADTAGEVVLSDVMGRDRSINLFAG